MISEVFIFIDPTYFFSIYIDEVEKTLALFMVFYILYSIILLNNFYWDNLPIYY
jgi:hypothetical protein